MKTVKENFKKFQSTSLFTMSSIGDIYRQRKKIWYEFLFKKTWSKLNYIYFLWNFSKQFLSFVRHKWILHFLQYVCVFFIQFWFLHVELCSLLSLLGRWSTVSRHTAVGGLTSQLRLIHDCSAFNDASDGLPRERCSAFSSDNRHSTISSRKNISPAVWLLVHDCACNQIGIPTSLQFWNQLKSHKKKIWILSVDGFCPL
jgi:hypothetical protein